MEIPTAQQGEYSLYSMEFWLEEAHVLKETAELCWSSDMGVNDRVKLIYSPHHNRVLSHVTEELGVELNLLYRYLISLAIQYLAIGILIGRDPGVFLQKKPGHKIVALVEACDVEPSAEQRKLLQGIENAYDWAERYPVGELARGDDELRQLTHRISAMDRLSVEEKRTLDELYVSLRAVAKNRRR
jgi:hypothetical protein